MASGRVPKMTLIFTQGGDEYLVLCLLNGWCFAARDFRSRRGASDEHIPKWICKERATKPGPKRPAALRVAPRLACGFVARRSQPHFGGCSLLAPRHRPTWAQQNTSDLGDTTLAAQNFWTRKIPLTRPTGTLSPRRGEGWGEGSVWIRHP